MLLCTKYGGISQVRKGQKTGVLWQAACCLLASIVSYLQPCSADRQPVDNNMNSGRQYSARGMKPRPYAYKLSLRAPSLRERVLHFPKDYALGELLIQTYPPNGRDQGVRGAARGTIVVPPGRLCKFIPGARFYQNPALIKTLPPDGIDTICLSASSLDDSEDGLCDRALTYVGHLTGVIELNLDRSDASDAGAAHAADLPNLQKFTGLSVGLDGKCFKQFAALKQLECIHIPRNSLKDENLVYLTALPKLWSLTASYCNLSDTSVKILAKCSNLKYLNIGDNPKITDQSIKYLLGMKSLRSLVIYNTSISPAGVLQLKALPLSSLELSSKKFTPAQIDVIIKAFPGVYINFGGKEVKSVDSDTGTIFGPLH